MPNATPYPLPKETPSKPKPNSKLTVERAVTRRSGDSPDSPGHAQGTSSSSPAKEREGSAVDSKQLVVDTAPRLKSEPSSSSLASPTSSSLFPRLLPTALRRKSIAVRPPAPPDQPASQPPSPPPKPQALRAPQVAVTSDPKRRSSIVEIAIEIPSNAPVASHSRSAAETGKPSMDQTSSGTNGGASRTATGEGSKSAPIEPASSSRPPSNPPSDTTPQARRRSSLNPAPSHHRYSRSLPTLVLPASEDDLRPPDLPPRPTLAAESESSAPSSYSSSTHGHSYSIPMPDNPNLAVPQPGSGGIGRHIVRRMGSSEVGYKSDGDQTPKRNLGGNIKGRIAAWTSAASMSSSSSASSSPVAASPSELPPTTRKRVDSNNTLSSWKFKTRSPWSSSPTIDSQPPPTGHVPSMFPSAWKGALHPHRGQSDAPVSSLGAVASGAGGIALGLGKRGWDKMEKLWSSGMGTSGNVSLLGMGPHNRSDSNGTNLTSVQSGSGTTSSRSTSGSQADANWMTPTALELPIPVRLPLRKEGGLVFGRRLEDCVSDTRIDGNVEEGDPLWCPAVVVRCIQHLQIWGVQEEGLFRITGRSSHVAKLRAEFDTGADIDLRECTPGDLDPHAVSSLFKSYLRELPEKILTRSLAPQFDYVMTNGVAYEAGDALPSGAGSASFGGGAVLPLDAQNYETLGVELSKVVCKLPREHYDLLLEICKLLRYTAARNETTKMPLSNLLLVFCPSLSMNPGLLKALVENQDSIFVRQGREKSARNSESRQASQSSRGSPRKASDDTSYSSGSPSTPRRAAQSASVHPAPITLSSTHPVLSPTRAVVESPISSPASSLRPHTAPTSTYRTVTPKSSTTFPQTLSSLRNVLSSPQTPSSSRTATQTSPGTPNSFRNLIGRSPRRPSVATLFDQPAPLTGPSASPVLTLSLVDDSDPFSSAFPSATLEPTPPRIPPKPERLRSETSPPTSPPNPAVNLFRASMVVSPSPPSTPSTPSTPIAPTPRPSHLETESVAPRISLSNGLGSNTTQDWASSVLSAAHAATNLNRRESGALVAAGP